MKRLTLFLCSIMLAAVACSSTKELSTTSTETVKSGKKFTLSMKSNPSTGYRWVWANKAEAAADSVSYEFVADENKSKMMGAGGTDTWTFKAKAEGADSLVFLYVRPWDKETAPADSMVFHFKVK